MRAEGTRAGGSQLGEVQCSPRAKTRVVVALLSPAVTPALQHLASALFAWCWNYQGE